MDYQQLTVGIIFIIGGGIYAFRPDLAARFQKWQARVIMGARYEPSIRTLRIIRIIGAVFFVVGLMLITSSRT